MEYIIIISTCLLFFARTLRYGIVVDDIENRSRGDYYDKKHKWFYRPLLRLNGTYPVRSIVLDHAITLGLHTLVCMLVYKAFDNLPAAMLFAVNVGNNQVSLWLNGKRYAVNTALCLLAVIVPFGFLLLIVASLFQISAITFPIFLAMNGNPMALAIIPIMFLFGSKHIVKWIIKKYEDCRVKEYYTWRPAKVVFMLKTIAFYFIRGVFPFAPTMFPQQFKRFGLIDVETKDAYRFDVQALAGAVIVVMAVAGQIINPTLFVGMTWWLVTVIVFGNLLTLTVPLAERYMYLPNVGLMVFVATLLSMIHPLAWVVVFVLYVSRLIIFMPMYQDIDKFLKHHCHFYPENDQVWVFRANRQAKENDIFGVMHLANEGLVANRDSSMLWLHRATGFLSLGQKALCGECLKMAKRYARDEYSNVVSEKIREVELLKGD